MGILQLASMPFPAPWGSQVYANDALAAGRWLRRRGPCAPRRREVDWGVRAAALEDFYGDRVAAVTPRSGRA